MKKFKSVFFVIVFLIIPSTQLSGKELSNVIGQDTYKIKKGDTLWSISEKLLGESSMWKEILKVNSTITNPNLIYPGQTIRLKAVKKVDKKLVERTKKELSETLALNNKTLKALDHKEPELKSKLKTKDVAFNEASEKRLIGKVGEVDIFRVIEESKKVKNALKSSKDVSSLSEALFDGNQNPIGEIVTDVVKIIKEYGKKEGFIDISDKYEKWVVYTEERVDITDKVIELYNKNLEASN